jgi:hypothetical protein
VASLLQARERSHSHMNVVVYIIENTQHRILRTSIRALCSGLWESQWDVVTVPSGVAGDALCQLKGVLPQDPSVCSRMVCLSWCRALLQGSLD